MKLIRIILTLLVLVIALPPAAVDASGMPAPAAAPALQEDTGAVVVVRVYYDSPDEIYLLFDYDLFEYNNRAEKYVLVAVNPAELAALKALGLRVEVDEEQTANLNLAWLAVGGLEPSAYTCYRSVEETSLDAEAIAIQHPGLAEWIDIGDSWEKSVGQTGGADIMVLKLTNKAITGDKPRLLVAAGIHPYEYATHEMALRFGEYLVSQYGVNADVTWILDHHEVHLLLVANPDGHQEVEQGSYWRKNTNESVCGVTSRNRGVDLNRNFNFQWDCCGGASDSPCNEMYHGISPASEPEVQAVQGYLQALFPDRRGPNLGDLAPKDTAGIYIDLHSFGNEVLWPWGFTGSPPPNNAQLQTLGRKFAFFNNYGPLQSVGYMVDGSSDDYAYGVLGVAAFSWELGTTFFHDCATFTNSMVPGNLAALLYAARVARSPYQAPAGPDAIDLALSAASVPAGAPVTLTATATDGLYNNSNGAEPVQKIAAAEYTIDNPPWASGAAANPMAAADGTFDKPVEGVTAQINTSSLSSGRHTLFVRSKDANGSWGAVSAVYLVVEGPPNQVPLAVDLSAETDEDAPVSLKLAGSDADGDPITFQVIDGPGHGRLSGTAPSLTYTPDANFSGDDFFTFFTNDGKVDSAEAVVNITVIQVNDAPAAGSLPGLEVVEDTPTAIELAGSDPEGDALTYIIQAQPLHGQLNGTAPALTYTPEADYYGPDTFSFVANDGEASSEPAEVGITVLPVNDPPAAEAQSILTTQDTAVTVVLAGSDDDEGELVFSIVTPPAQGKLEGAPPNLVYTPAAGYAGTDSFTFKVSDGMEPPAEAQVSITVTPPGTQGDISGNFELFMAKLEAMLEEMSTSQGFSDAMDLMKGRLDLLLDELSVSFGNK